MKESIKILQGKKLYKKVCSYCGNEVSYNHSYKPVTCPHCNARNWSKPPTETQLFLLQKQYIDTRDKKYLGEMYMILVSYISSMIKRMLSGNYIYDSDFIEEKSSDAANLLIDYYLSKPEFIIQQSFAGYLRDKIKEVLYSDADEEIHESLNAHFEDNDKEAIDYVSQYNYQPLFQQDKEFNSPEYTYRDKDIIDGVSTILDNVFDEIKANFPPLAYLSLIVATNHMINKQTEEFMSKFYTEYGTNLSETVQKILFIIFSFLKEYHHEH